MAVINHWHKLPREVLAPSSLKAFKSKLNVLLEYTLYLKAGCGFQRRSELEEIMTSLGEVRLGYLRPERSIMQTKKFLGKTFLSNPFTSPLFRLL